MSDLTRSYEKVYAHICVVVIALLSSIDKAEALERIDDVLKYVQKELDEASKKHPIPPSTPYHALNIRQIPQLSLRLKQTLLDLSPHGSEYWKYAASFSAPFKPDSVAQLFGTLKSLREEYENDFLSGFNEMIGAELFTGILEQAEYLLSQSYVRASAVVAGVALESHIRKLAEKNSIPITKDDGGHINAEFLNSELRKREIIDKTINKSITSWLGLRNDAAHPDKKEINEGLIEPMIVGIRVFIQQYPA